MQRTQHRITSAFIFALTFNLILLHWTSIYVGSTPWLILALGLAILYLPLALVGRWGISAYPLIFIALEELRNRFPFGGFGWGRIAYSQADAPYSQFARFGGASGLSALVLLIALCMYSGLHAPRNLVILAPVFVLLLPVNITPVTPIKVLAIQGNVPQLGLDFNARATQVFQNHVRESAVALRHYPNVDLLVWPENAVDVDPFTNVEVSKTLNTFSQPLLVGAITQRGSNVFNSSLLWTKEHVFVYDKQHLTPFGEYIPLRTVASKISALVNQVSGFSAGRHSTIFNVKSARIAPIICYELLDDRILAQAAKEANIFAVQTNSATFGISPESAQQLSITRIRAIEHSRNIVSVSTTGYSAEINYEGRVIQKTPINRAHYIYAEVGLIEQRSPRDWAGNWALAAIGIWLLWVARRAGMYRR